ncbi:MAG: hypothetical protein ACI8R4_001044 [Paracoccaceae bacterium]|jgi:hypothetical protein
MVMAGLPFDVFTLRYGIAVGKPVGLVTLRLYEQGKGVTACNIWKNASPI